MAKSKAAKSPAWKVNPMPGANEYVNSVSISADGTKVLGGTYYFNYEGAGHAPATTPQITVGVFAWNNSGLLLWKAEFSATEGIYWVALSGDGSYAASGGLLAHGKGLVYVYNASGKNVLSYNPPARTNMVALDQKGDYLVAGADALYLFKRTGTTWNNTPQIIQSPVSGDTVISVGISADGQWIVAGTYNGVVMLVKNTNGVPGQPVTWQLQNGKINWIAIAAGGTGFAAAGSDAKVYFFNVANFPASKKPAWSAALTGCSNCRSVAVTSDGSLISAVANDASAGQLFLLANNGTTSKQLWAKPTLHSPNSTSIDAAGKYVTAADGYPDGKPGSFSLYATDGTQQWNYPTSNMSWPMMISANASGIAAGSDDSDIYYFTV